MVNSGMLAPTQRVVRESWDHRWEDEAAEEHGPILAPATYADDTEPYYVPSEGFGAPARTQAAVDALLRMVRHEEAQKPGSLAAKLAGRLGALIGRGSSNATLLFAALHLSEAHWRRAVIPDYVLRRLFDPQLFAAWKLVDLLAYDRSPLSVSEGFVRASGDLAGCELADRDIFYTRFAPRAPCQGGKASSHHVIIVAPGIGETGRNHHQQIDELTWRGHEVVAIDPMGAGQTRAVMGLPGFGHVDRGLGYARDLGRVVAHVAARLPPNGRIILLGQGTGGTAALMLLVAQVAGQLPFALPDKMDAVLQAPYLTAVPRVANKLVNLLGQVMPEASALPFLPRVAASAEARAQYAQCRQRDAVTVRAPTFARLRADIEGMLDGLRRGYRPGGRLIILHSADDPWADPGQSHRLGQQHYLGKHATVRILRGADHALCHVPQHRQETLWALRKLSRAHLPQ